ncbi:MerR family transcriptional regulator [Pantoea cypripedii]|uniref:MerR family transcriptional regulator n=1 Tax=Pantoea cypripedii TaxID=55209 RepID=UPI000A11D18C|nr:MerR family transcriptional regulator [Pantoea cypripedii]MBP2199573.1 DNA-binding transcriptional MerR regulator [Pantoea cypripedii]
MRYTTDEVCRLTHLCPEILRNWHRNNLIKIDLTQQVSDACLNDIRVIKALTSSGDTLEEIQQLLNDSWRYRPSGWPIRQRELRALIDNHSRFAINAHLRKLTRTYCFYDLTKYLFIPLIHQPASAINHLENHQFAVATIRELACITQYPCTVQKRLKSLQQPAFSFHGSLGLKTNEFNSHRVNNPGTVNRVTTVLPG